MSHNFAYSVAIRTLGTAGDKYQKELDSLINQTIPPTQILVYIAEGYEIPKETVGCETYIHVPKGMVAQRALDYSEVTTDYVLLLDDDVYLAPDTVEKLYQGLMDMNGDCIAVDIFKNQNLRFSNKILGFITNWAYPRKHDNWAFKVQRNGSFSYNNSPRNDVYLSQSAAGAVSLWKKSSLLSIRLKDELWMDDFPFAYGDDLLTFYKLYRNGGRLLIHYTVNVEHLDAGTSSGKYKKDTKRLYYRSLLWFVLWRRINYERADMSGFSRFLSGLSFFFKSVWGSLLHLGYSMIRLNITPFYYFCKGLIDGWRFVHSSIYKKIPNYIISPKR